MANREHLHAGPNWGSGSYLNGLHPALAAVHTGLAVFGFLVIVRFCLQRTRSWACSLRRSHSRSLQIEQGYCWQPNTTYNTPPPWLQTSEKQRIQDFSSTTMKTTPGNIGGTTEPVPSDSNKAGLMSSQLAGSGLRRQFLNRMPMAPPLTPPELQTRMYNFEDKKRMSLDDFMNQPNPNYSSAAPSDDTTDVQSTAISSATPRRRSYMKTLPIGIPTPETSLLSMPSGAGAEAEKTGDGIFSPGSYPPSSPQLPPAPPSAASEPTTPQSDSSAAISATAAASRRNIDVQGEIISVLDAKGAGWTRHTRVYGGGVCLACAASGGGHGEGGFYGATVSPEEMRY